MPSLESQKFLLVIRPFKENGFCPYALYYTHRDNEAFEKTFDNCLTEGEEAIPTIHEMLQEKIKEGYDCFVEYNGRIQHGLEYFSPGRILGKMSRNFDYYFLSGAMSDCKYSVTYLSR